MRTGIPVWVGVGLLSGVLAAGTLTAAQAGPPARAKRIRQKSAVRRPTGVIVSPRAESGLEKSLLGIRMLQTTKTVLNKLGPPSRIFRIDEMLYITYFTDPLGHSTGGVTDIISKGDQKDSSGSSTTTAQPEADPSADTEGGIPDNAGLPGGSPGPGGIGSASNQEKPPETFAQAGGYCWVYLFPVEQKAYTVWFYGDGRVFRVSEHGLGIGAATSRGIALGTPIGEVFRLYGWPDSMQETDQGVQLFYGTKHHCQFDVVNNRVNGVVVFLTEEMILRITKDTKNGGGGGGSSPPSGGRRSAGEPTAPGG